MKNLKKSEIVIYAISLMLVTAGYFNYATFEQETTDTYSEDISQIQEEYANTGDAVLVSNNEVEEQENLLEQNQSSDKEVIEQESAETQTVNEISNQEGAEEDVDDYYASTKLDREKMYANMISNYEQILNNQNVSEAQKSIATQEITNINNTKNAIMISENLIQTKGFNNVVILVNEESINVVVNTEEKLSQDKVAIIQNIISREFGEEIENIHISEK